MQDTTKFNYIHTRVYVDMRGLPELRRIGWTSGDRKGRKTIHRKMEQQMFGEHMFLMPHRDHGTQRGL